MRKAEAKALVAEALKRAKHLSPQSYLPQSPTPKQQTFLDSPNFEVLFGGAAGGGKSSALLMGAISQAVIGATALVVRRTYADLVLPGAIMDRSLEWLAGTPARWKPQDKQWIFPSGGILQFGYLDTEKDKYRYQGAEFQSIWVDELTQFTESQYTYLMSRIRRNMDKPFPLKVRAASNPGGIGHDWVYSRFVDKETAGERVFVPSTLDDNPHLDRESYREALERLDSTTRQQLLLGRWIRDDGGRIYEFSFEKNAIDMPPEESLERILAIDLGASAKEKSTAFCLVGFSYGDPDRVYVLESTAYADQTPSDIADVIRTYGDCRVVCDAGALGKGYVEEFRRRHGLAVEPARKSDKAAYRRLLNGDFNRGVVQVVAGTNKDLMRELHALTWDDKGRDVAPGQDDHLTDALLYAWREAKHYLAQQGDVPPSDPIAKAEWVARKMKEKTIQQTRISAGRRRHVSILPD